MTLLPSAPILLLLTIVSVASSSAGAQVRLSTITRAGDSVALGWEGGNGPFIVQTSHDLQTWSDLGEPATGNLRQLTTSCATAFYRVRDVDSAGLLGGPFGLIQTEQGEFGSMMARHRLKSRLWLYKSKGAPHNSGSYTPAAYWRKLLVHFQRLEDGRVSTWTGALEDLGSVATPTAQRLTVTWTAGSGSQQRTLVLTLDFPYSVNAGRTTAPFASDPIYSLKCTYATAQPELEFGGLPAGTTYVDSIGLIQLDPANDPVRSDQLFWVRRYQIKKGGVEVGHHHFEAGYLDKGRPKVILKTLPLDSWLSPSTGKGGVLPTFSTDSYFARTLLPGHHNFYEMILVEPGLDPSVPEQTRAALARANIRQVYTFKDLAGVTIGGDSEGIRFIGHDNSVRTP